MHHYVFYLLLLFFNYALRAKLCNYASVHNSGSPGEGIVRIAVITVISGFDIY